ncbi:hypothetical protein DRA43_31335, partial [Micromonospora provocatoris]
MWETDGLAGPDGSAELDGSAGPDGSDGLDGSDEPAEGVGSAVVTDGSGLGLGSGVPGSDGE